MKKKLQGFLENFVNPPENYGPIPFWFWNDDLKNEHLLFQIEQMYAKGIREFLIHARLGLQVPYLSETWFEKVAFVLEEAEKRGMYVWIYDEENWPSGYAGGLVLKQNPNHAGKYLDRVQNGAAAPQEGLLIAQDDQYCYYQCFCRYKAAYSDFDYTDMLSKEATQAFIDVTHREYYRRFKDKFGTRIKGFFVDEPGFYNNFEMYSSMPDHGTYTWTDAFPTYFMEKKGYDIRPVVGQLWKEGDSAALKTRLDYYDVLNQMYQENFLGELRKFCEGVGVQLIGHLHCEEFLPYHVKTQGDLIKSMAQLHASGVDRIDLSDEKITEKYGSSAEHIYGMGRTLSETFAITGWDMTLKEMRRWTNWQYVRGVNLMCLHAFFSCIEGSRQHDCPPSLFFQNPYWEYFEQYTAYIRRLSWTLTQGSFTAPLAVYYPIRTVQKIVRHDSIREAEQYDNGFIDMCCSFTKRQLDYDIINEDGLCAADMDSGRLVLNKNTYSALLLYDLQILEKAAANRIAEYAENGGVVIFVGKCEPVDETGASLQAEMERIKRCPGFRHMSPYHHGWNKAYAYAFSAEKVAGILGHFRALQMNLRFPDEQIHCMHRVLEMGDLYFVCNNAYTPRNNTLLIPGTAAQILRLDPTNGEVTRFSVVQGSDAVELPVELQPGEGILYLMLHEDCQADAPLRKDDILWTEEQQLHKADISGLADAALQDMPLRPWSEYGYPHHSGKVRYDFTLHAALQPERRYILRLGQVSHTAEVYVNGVFAKNLVWDPYEVDVTEMLADGENKITVYVTNTLGNRLNRHPYVSGLLGPIVLCSCKA